MLVVIIIVKVTTVLLDIRVNTKGARVDLLHAEIISLQLAINLTLLSAIGTGNPNTLNFLASDNVIPV